MKIALCGFKNVGKTRIGKKISLYFGIPFIETDKLIEAIFFEQEKEALSFKEIYLKIGEEPFRALERFAIEKAVLTQTGVISLGGGSLCQEANLSLIKNWGLLVYLKASKGILKGRFLKNPPLYLEEKEGEEKAFYFEKIYGERLPIFEKEADMEIESKSWKTIYGK